MKERPIIFSGSMIQAMLDGRKTQTRRVFKNAPEDMVGWSNNLIRLRASTLAPLRFCPYGVPGDRLWVRETFVLGVVEELPDDDRPYQTLTEQEIDWCPWDGEYRVPFYRATEPEPHIVPYDLEDGLDDRTRWSPSIFMPRWASRITLDVLNVRVDKLTNIHNEDAIAEGVDKAGYGETVLLLGLNAIPAMSRPIFDFAVLWNKFNKKRGFGWHRNPWVWVVELRVVEDGRNGRDRSVHNNRAGPVSGL